MGEADTEEGVEPEATELTDIAFTWIQKMDGLGNTVNQEAAEVVEDMVKTEPVAPEDTGGLTHQVMEAIIFKVSVAETEETVESLLEEVAREKGFQKVERSHLEEKAEMELLS